jgi:drug/metabolite transporter (DMT)-like permease
MTQKATLTNQAVISADQSQPARLPLWQGWALALLTSASFSTMPPVLKYAINLGLDPPQLLAMRYLLATLLLSGTVAIIAPRRLRADRQLILFAAIGGLGYATTVFLYSYSLTRLNASIASMTFSLYPLVALGALAFFGEKFTHRNIVRLGLGLSGVYLLIGPGGQVDPVGVMLVIGAMVTMTVYLITVQGRLAAYDELTVAVYLVAAMTIAINLAWLVGGVTWQSPGGRGWLAIGWMAIIGTYLAQMTMVTSIRIVGGGQVVLLNPLETFMTVIWSVLFLSESLTPIQWAGGGLILLSALLAIQRLRRAKSINIGGD